MSNVVVIVCCKKILESAHVKFPNFKFFNSNAWLEFERLNFIRMFERSYLSVQNKNAAKNIGSSFSLKAKVTNKKAQSLKVNSGIG